MPTLLFILSLVFCSGFAFAQTPPDPAAQREAIGRLAWMAGRWEGISTTLVREGQVRAISREWISMAAGGTALMILGIHHRLQPDGGKGEVTHDAAERGELCRDGQAPCAPVVFDMVLDRKGDAAW